VEIVRIPSSSLWPEAVHAADGFVFLSGQSAHESNALPESENWLVESIEGETAAQIMAVYRQIAASLERAGSALEQIVLMNGWYADFREWPVMDRLRRSFFDRSAYPVSTGFGAAGFASDRTRALFEVIAVTKDRERQVVGNPLQVGSYAAGSKVGSLFFLAGEVPADIEAGKVITAPEDLGSAAPKVATGVFGLDGWEGKIRAQTWSVYDRIRRTLEDAGSGLDRIVKQNVYLRDLRDLPGFSRMSREILGDARPATTIVNVSEYGHQDFDLEVEITACDRALDFTTLDAEGRSYADYPDATIAPPFVFLSGLVGVKHDVRGEQLPLEDQTQSIYDEAERVLAAADLDRRALVRQVIYVADPRQIPAIEAIALERTNGATPATTFVGVDEIVPRNASVQIDFTAVTG
jgi:enamine deaminase RidA (YjgF/YER057c/UK114 family)